MKNNLSKYHTWTLILLLATVIILVVGQCMFNKSNAVSLLIVYGISAFLVFMTFFVQLRALFAFIEQRKNKIEIKDEDDNEE